MTFSDFYWIIFVLFFWNISAQIPSLDLPIPTHQVEGIEIFNQIRDLDLVSREEFIYQTFSSGNIPTFMRKLVPINFIEHVNGIKYEVEIYVSADYLGLGSDKDYFLMPLTPKVAQQIGNLVNCTIPTRKMVDIIWKKSPLKLKPIPIPPSDSMTSAIVMYIHNNLVKTQIDSLREIPSGKVLMSGHKKDIVLSNRKTVAKVHIYGWHDLDSRPIQPLYSGHTDQWVDYSHGIRLIYEKAKINGVVMKISEILQHRELHLLLSDEGQF